MLHVGVPQAAEAPDCGDAVTIGRGQTLSSVARACGTSVPALLEANSHIGDPDVVGVGTAIRIPKRDVGSEPGPAAEGGTAATGPERGISLLAQPNDPGPAGWVTLSASRLPARAIVWIRGGWSERGQIILRRGLVGADGTLQVRMRLPQRSLRDGTPGRYRFSVSVPQTGRTLWSEPVEIPPPAEDAPGRGAGPGEARPGPTAGTVARSGAAPAPPYCDDPWT